MELSRGRVVVDASPVEVLPVDGAEQEVEELHADEEQEVHRCPTAFVYAHSERVYGPLCYA